MKLKNVSNQEKSQVVLEIEVGAEEFNEGINKAFKQNVKKINVPGFRKGKAPKSFIEKMYGENVFYEDAVNLTYPTAYEDALKESKIDPVDRADIEVLDITKDGYTFKATVSVKPDVTLGEYKGIKATKTKAAVSKEDIENELSNIRTRYSRLITVTDRAAKLEDNVIIDFEGFVDGVAFEGGKGENFDLKLGSGQFIPGFEEQLVGKNIDENVEVKVTFPAEYQAEELAGKDAIFNVTIKEIKFTELPELDDEFAKDASEFDTIDAYKAKIKEDLLKSKEEASEQALETQIIDNVVEGLKGEIPDCMIEHQIDNIVADNDQRMRAQGLDIASYLKYSGMDMKAFREMFKVQATKQVKMRLALEKIVELEKIVISEEEINEEIQKMAEMYKMEVEKIKSIVPIEEIGKDIAVGKAVEFIKNQAEITEETAKKPAAKKSAPKKAEEKKPAAKKTTAKTAKKDEVKE
ncbi:MAG: trigger factor [Clostridia bacterium]